MTAHYKQVTIVGVGLLGGSLGLALKLAGLAERVRGVGHRQSSLDTARDCGAVDETYLNVSDALAGTDLVVLCTPAAMVPHLLDTIRDKCHPDALVTDVASTKAAICEHAEQTWPKPLRFVGSHPMAGSEKFGAENAYASLYEGSSVLVTPTTHSDANYVARTKTLWESVGANVVEMAPDLHDRLVANTSHVPHIVAACLAELAANSGGAKAVIGNGFRDMTRIAAGRSEIWRDICMTNPQAISTGLNELRKLLDEVRGMIDTGDAAALERFFTEAHKARDRAMRE
jgi:prephenate dehydrogenase